MDDIVYCVGSGIKPLTSPCESATLESLRTLGTSDTIGTSSASSTLEPLRTLSASDTIGTGCASNTVCTINPLRALRTNSPRRQSSGIVPAPVGCVVGWPVSSAICRNWGDADGSDVTFGYDVTDNIDCAVVNLTAILASTYLRALRTLKSLRTLETSRSLRASIACAFKSLRPLRTSRALHASSASSAIGTAIQTRFTLRALRSASTTEVFGHEDGPIGLTLSSGKSDESGACR